MVRPKLRIWGQEFESLRARHLPTILTRHNGSRLFSRSDHQGWFWSPQIVQLDARHGMLERQIDHADDLRRRVFRRQSNRTNIGYAVAARIHHADLWPPRNIGTERVGRRQTRAFADQDYEELGAKQFADLVTDCHASLLDKNEWSDREATIQQEPSQVIEQRQKIDLDGRCGEAVGGD